MKKDSLAVVKNLGFTEGCLKGGLEAKLSFLEKFGHWIEIENQKPRDLTILESYKVEVRTVQAHRLHRLQWLSAESSLRQAALEHVLETVKIAEELGAKNILTVPTYGFNIDPGSRKRCLENYKKVAGETELTILIEPLSPLRTGFLPSPFEVARLLDELNMDKVMLAADTLHIKESGHNPAEVISTLNEKIGEIHLKDDGATPPGEGEIDFKSVLKNSKGLLLCMEFGPANKKRIMNARSHVLAR